jgi:FAD/FMN-containing dehydrogenase
MPAYTASRDLCAVGGMVSNNAGGEKSIHYGKTENYIRELKVVFRDGYEYVVKPLTRKELMQKIGTVGFEAEMYKELTRTDTTRDSRQVKKLRSDPQQLHDQNNYTNNSLHSVRP